MARRTMTFGVMPSREEFDAAWDAHFADMSVKGFAFGNDPRLGNVVLETPDELWDELQKALADYNLPEDGPNAASSCFIADTGDWLSSVLGCLGFEWV